MTDFVDRLLGRVEPPPIRPLIPIMFEPLTRRPEDRPLPMGQFSDTGVGIAAEPPVYAYDDIPGGAPPGQLVPGTSRPGGLLVPGTPVTAPPEPSQPPESVVRELHTHTRQDHSHSTERLIAETQKCDVTVQKCDVTVAAQRYPSPASAEAPPGPAAMDADHPVPHTVSKPILPPTRARTAGPARVVAQRAPRAAEPDVRISIGRVEIKAAPAPAPAHGQNPVQGPKRPQLSLDDYLRARGADRR